MNKTWIENQIQIEQQYMLRAEGALLALKAMLKEVEAGERQATEQPEAAEPASPVEEQGGAAESWDTPALAAACDAGLRKLNGDGDAD